MILSLHLLPRPPVLRNTSYILTPPPGSQAADDIAIPKNFFITTYTRVACSYCRDEFISPKSMDGDGVLLKPPESGHSACCCKRLSTQSGRLKQTTFIRHPNEGPRKVEEPGPPPSCLPWTQIQFSSVQFNPPRCGESLLQFNRFHNIPELHMPSEAGPTIVCWLILSPMDHSFMPKWTWKSYQSDFKAWWFHPGGS